MKEVIVLRWSTEEATKGVEKTLTEDKEGKPALQSLVTKRE
jgi:hypothetical protein